MKKIYIALLFISTLGAACSDFLKEDSQDQVYVKTVADIDELLIGEVYASQTIIPLTVGNYADCDMKDYFPWIQLMDDDTEENPCYSNVSSSSGNNGHPRQKLFGFHCWLDNPWQDLNELPVSNESWKAFYRHIAVANSLLFQIDKYRGSGEDSDEEFDRVKGECLFARAFYYWMLVNFYALPYTTAEEAARTEAVPLKISEDVDGGYFKRESLQRIYEQIISDLKEAALCLDGVSQKVRFRASKDAAHALLSRVYLYQQQYDLAVTYADSVLGSSYSLLDFNQYDKVGPNYATSPETIFTMGTNGYYYYMDAEDLYETGNFKISSSLQASYGRDDNDLRLSRFFVPTAKADGLLVRKQAMAGGTSADGGIVSDVFLIRVAEMYLNKAEALALSGHPDQAKTTLQTLRACRIKTGQLTGITETGNDLIQFIRDERRRELCLEGHRWFDLRRYAVNAVYPHSEPIRHSHWQDATRNTFVYMGEYELKPYNEDKAARVIPIPDYEVEYNKGNLQSMPDNLVRVERNAN